MIARPSAPSERSARRWVSDSNRSRHSSARALSRSRASLSSTASAAARPVRRVRCSSRATRRTIVGSAAGLLGGGASARPIVARTIGGKRCWSRSPPTSASRTRSAHARSSSSFVASMDAAMRGPSRVREPSRSDSHTALGRGGTGAASNAMSARSPIALGSVSVGLKSAPSCHAARRSAPTASLASSSIVAATFVRDDSSPS